MDLGEFFKEELKEDVTCKIDIDASQAINITNENQVSIIEGLNLLKIREDIRSKEGYTVTTKEYVPISAIKKITFIKKIPKPHDIHTRQ